MSDVRPDTGTSNHWRRSSRCGPNGGNCVEVRHGGTAVAVRDSKNPAGARLSFSGTTWRSFLRS